MLGNTSREQATHSNTRCPRVSKEKGIAGGMCVSYLHGCNWRDSIIQDHHWIYGAWLTPCVLQHSSCSEGLPKTWVSGHKNTFTVNFQRKVRPSFFITHKTYAHRRHKSWRQRWWDSYHNIYPYRSLELQEQKIKCFSEDVSCRYKTANRLCSSTV